MRELVWGKEKAFEGFECNGCGWLIPNPTMNSKATNEKEVIAEAEEKFAAHKCEDYPLKAE
jgi:hypothetical protein